MAGFSIATMVMAGKKAFLSIYLTPFIPLSFKGEGERVFREGAKPPPLLYSPFPSIK